MIFFICVSLQGCSQDFLNGGGGRDPPAKLNFHWSTFTGVCFPCQCLRINQSLYVLGTVLGLFTS